MLELEQAFSELQATLIQQAAIIFQFLGAIWAIWRCCMGGLRYLNGEKDAIGRVIFQIIVGIAVIYLAPNFVYLITQFFNILSESVPTFGG